jgi:tetratricopeptide (TPR) repeat protein
MLTTAQLNLGKVLLDTGRPEEAVEAFRAASKVGQDLANEFPFDPDHRDGWALSLSNLAGALWALGKSGESLRVFEEVLEVQEHLAADFPAVPDYRYALAAARGNLGVLLESLERFEEAQKSYERSIVILQELARRYPAVPEYQYGLAGHRGNLAECLRHVNQPRAEAISREAIEGLDRLVAKFPQTVEYRRLRANLLKAGGRYAEARDAYRELLKGSPDHAKAHREFAWLLATCPDPRFRDPQEAIGVAKRAVALAPEAADGWDTLGVAHYRGGAWRTAIESLGRGAKLRKGGDGLEGFFLAMAHWQLSERDQARSWYDRAIAWMEKNRPKDEELIGLRNEAAALLGLADQPKPTGKKEEIPTKPSKP